MNLFVPIVAYTRIERQPFQVTTPTGEVMECHTNGRHQFTTREGQVLELYHERELTEEDHRQAALCLAWIAAGMPGQNKGANP